MSNKHTTTSETQHGCSEEETSEVVEEEELVDRSGGRGRKGRVGGPDVKQGGQDGRWREGGGRS